MEPNNKPRTSAKDFFLNLGAIVAIYTVVIALINLLFTVINVAYPKITNAYSYYLGSASISFPVATVIIFFPIYVLLTYLLERSFMSDAEKRFLGVRKWLSYITLFVAGLALAGDLVTVLYYFLDGQELTLGFLLKVLTVLVVALCVFWYYLSDIRGKLTSYGQKIWLGISLVIIIGSISWGFMVLGSPSTQRLVKYDLQRVSDLQNLDGQIRNYWEIKRALPNTFADMSQVNTYIDVPKDPQTQEAYKYTKTADKTYTLCTTFNRDSSKNNTYTNYISDMVFSKHPAGAYCFSREVSELPTAYPAKAVTY